MNKYLWFYPWFSGSWCSTVSVTWSISLSVRSYCSSSRPPSTAALPCWEGPAPPSLQIPPVTCGPKSCSARQWLRTQTPPVTHPVICWRERFSTDVRWTHLCLIPSICFCAARSASTGNRQTKSRLHSEVWFVDRMQAEIFLHTVECKISTKTEYFSPKCLISSQKISEASKESELFLDNLLLSSKKADF